MADVKGLRSFRSPTPDASTILQSRQVLSELVSESRDSRAMPRSEHSKRIVPSTCYGTSTRFRNIARDPKFGQYVRIPRRICQCMDGMGIAFNRSVAWTRLLSYYLFLGVVDEALDTRQSFVGEQVLGRLRSPTPDFDLTTRSSNVAFMTEYLKSSMPLPSYQFVESRLRRLYSAVVAERSSNSYVEFIRQRERVGRLSADVSYWLLRPLLDSHSPALRRFLQQVGQVGCLVDSVIDMTSDVRRGLLSFRPSLRNRMQLLGRTVRRGFPILMAHPLACASFVEAIADTLRDRQRRRELAPQ